MSRSIHTTRRTLSRLCKERYSSDEHHEAILKKAGQSLRHKRRIKVQVAAERSRAEPPLAGAAPETIPIEVVPSASPFEHHGASPEDIRAILSLLPRAATEGIGRIQLLLGKQDQEESAPGNVEPDPFTGRVGYETLPGIYAGQYLGSYHPRSGLLAIYAFVYVTSKLMLPQPVCEIYLRLHALKTFVHEVAHHHDQTTRVARGRWRADSKDTVEQYAEKMQHVWTQEFVLPYLARVYPGEIDALLGWVEERGGMKTDLAFFAGDCRRTDRRGLKRLLVDTVDAFEVWAMEQVKYSSLLESHLAFAWQLHYADKYDDCLKLVNKLLSKYADSCAVKACKADTLIHLGRFDEALQLSDELLQQNPAEPDYWKIRADALEEKAEWNLLLETCDAWSEQPAAKDTSGKAIALFRAIAFCGLGQNAHMDANIDTFITYLQQRARETPDQRRARILKMVQRRAGKS